MTTFEDRLLGELQRLVADRADRADRAARTQPVHQTHADQTHADQNRPADHTRPVEQTGGSGPCRRPSPRWYARPRTLVAAAAVTVLAAGAALGLPLLTARESSPAWAVTPSTNGWYTVVIHDFRDPAGLERRLHELGVAARVEYGRGPGLCGSHDVPFGGRVRMGWQMRDTHEPMRFQVRPAGFGPGDTLVAFVFESRRTDGRLRSTGLGVGITRPPLHACDNPASPARQ